MRRTIQKELEDPLAHLILQEEYPYGTTFIVEGREGKLKIRPQNVPLETIHEEVVGDTALAGRA
jgi:hypothetical protein